MELAQREAVTGVNRLVCMEFRSCEQGKRADREPSAPVWPEVVDVAGLSLSELRRRLGLIKKSEARLAAMKTAALAEYASRGGEGLARRVALDELQASKQQVRPRGRKQNRGRAGRPGAPTAKRLQHLPPPLRARHARPSRIRGPMGKKQPEKTLITGGPKNGVRSRGPPHRGVVQRRPHRYRQPRAGVHKLPSQHPRRRLGSDPAKRRCLRTQTPTQTPRPPATLAIQTRQALPGNRPIPRNRNQHDSSHRPPAGTPELGPAPTLERLLWIPRP